MASPIQPSVWCLDEKHDTFLPCCWLPVAAGQRAEHRWPSQSSRRQRFVEYGGRRRVVPRSTEDDIRVGRSAARLSLGCGRVGAWFHCGSKPQMLVSTSATTLPAKKRRVPCRCPPSPANRVAIRIDDRRQWSISRSSALREEVLPGNVSACRDVGRRRLRQLPTKERVQDPRAEEEIDPTVWDIVVKH